VGPGCQWHCGAAAEPRSLRGSPWQCLASLRGRGRSEALRGRGRRPLTRRTQLQWVQFGPRRPGGVAAARAGPLNTVTEAQIRVRFENAQTRLIPRIDFGKGCRVSIFAEEAVPAFARVLFGLGRLQQQDGATSDLLLTKKEALEKTNNMLRMVSMDVGDR
jgi:hypothetical protein